MSKVKKWVASLERKGNQSNEEVVLEGLKEAFLEHLNDPESVPGPFEVTVQIAEMPLTEMYVGVRMIQTQSFSAEYEA